ncbi:hypothetical protein HID58_094081, partial [Brassica napus]
TPKDEPKTYYGGEAPRKLQLHQAYLEELQNPQLKQDLRNMIDQSLTAVMEKPQQTSAPRPASRDYELCCYQKEPELVRPPDQSARFLLVFRDLMLSFYPGEHRTHAETAMVEACLWSKWREAFAAAVGYELNGKESFVCYILRHVRSLEMIE